MIRRHLLQAADSKTAKGAPLADVLYIPEVFSAERKAELAHRHVSAVSKIAFGTTGPRRLMLLIGEVKEFASRTRPQARRQAPAGPSAHESTGAAGSTEYLWDAVAGAHLIVIATFGVAPNGVTAVEELALMVVTETWIPIEHIYAPRLGLDGRPGPRAGVSRARAVEGRSPMIGGSCSAPGL